MIDIPALLGGQRRLGDLVIEGEIDLGDLARSTRGRFEGPGSTSPSGSFREFLRKNLTRCQGTTMVMLTGRGYAQDLDRFLNSPRDNINVQTVKDQE